MNGQRIFQLKILNVSFNKNTAATSSVVPIDPQLTVSTSNF